MAVGCVTVTVFVLVHPVTSVTVTEYVPADNPEAAELLCPEGFQLYVYGEVPPVTAAFADPVVPPKHTLAVAVGVTVNPEAERMVTTTVVVSFGQEESTMVHEYDPAPRLLIALVLAPVFHVYV